MKKLLSLYFVLTIFATSSISFAGEIIAASYNIHMAPKPDSNAWQYRKGSVNRLVRYHNFDIFGTQEGFFHQLEDIKGNDNTYEYVATGRDDGKKEGETAAIFYKPSRFELLDSGSFWYSQTPDTPSKGWDAMCKRVCTWAKFKDKKDNAEFFVFNSHFDHMGIIARENSAKMLIAKMKEIAGDRLPYFAMGDFNAMPNESPIKIILNSNSVLDSKKVSQTPPYGTRRTWQGYDLNQTKIPERIDYIFVSPQIKVLTHAVLNDLISDDDSSDYGKNSEKTGVENVIAPKAVVNKATVYTPSDHYPVATKLFIPEIFTPKPTWKSRNFK